MKKSAGYVLFVVIVIPCCMLAHPQAEAKNTLSFETASIHEEHGGDSRMSHAFRFSANGLEAKGSTVKSLLRYAYHLRDDQILDEGQSLTVPQYTVRAKISPELIKIMDQSNEEHRAEIRRMLIASLLRDRFHVAMHTETRITDGFDLAVAKAGVRMQKSAQNTAGNAVVKTEEKDVQIHGTVKFYPGRIEADAATMADLAKYLSAEMGKTVQDRTELSGAYAFDLRYNPASSGMTGLLSNGIIVKSTTQNGDYPEVPQAIKQLGLQLSPAKVTELVLVVEKVGKIEPN